MRAVVAHNEEMIIFLLSKGADALRIRDADGRTAYDLACRQKGTPLAHLLDPSQQEVALPLRPTFVVIPTFSPFLFPLLSLLHLPPLFLPLTCTQHTFVNEPIEIGQNIKHRVALLDAASKREYDQKVAEGYVPKHKDLFELNEVT
jgi:hypothetical protein